MTPLPILNFSCVNLGERVRSDYNKIEELAQSILDNGLIQPLVLVPLGSMQPSLGDVELTPVFGLDAGGRRYYALRLLLERGEWDGILHHAVTSEYEPLRAGYILKGESFATPLQRLLTEIAENLDREDPDWRDQTKAIVKAWRLAQREAHANSENILMRDFGAMLGCGYSHLQAANAIHDDLITNPDRYKDVMGIRSAWAKLLKVNEAELLKLQAAKSIQTRVAPSQVSIQSEPEPEEPPPFNVPITSAFSNIDSLAYMASLTEPVFDHIVTDPDYGVSVERLEAGVVGASSGIAQLNIEASAADTITFICLAWKVIKPQGFLVFWYDLDYHERLQRAAEQVGFCVQRWPLIWHKTDYRSNSAPGHNFCKNIEYAMVCRKPNAVLAKTQMTSIYSCPSGNAVKAFGHPFAKPLELSKWIYSAIAIKGQTVYDPFLGSGAISLAALEWGLRPVGSEINPDHFNNALANLQVGYRKLLGDKITFS